MTQGPEQRRLVRLAHTINVKAKKLGAPGRVTAADLARIQMRDEFTCAYCGIEVRPGSFDHVRPFDRGGTNLPDNIVVSCLTCNRTKYTKSPEQLREWEQLRVTCDCGVVFRPRWSDWVRGFGRVHSRACAARRSHRGRVPA